MKIMEMNQEELIVEAVKAMLRNGDMAEHEKYEAWKAFWSMCVGGVLVQMVIDGQMGMEWKCNQLHFSIIKEELCKK